MNLRQQLEMLVTSHNIFLRQRARTMSNILLLRNVHPLYRADMARRLYDNKLLFIMFYDSNAINYY